MNRAYYQVHLTDSSEPRTKQLVECGDGQSSDKENKNALCEPHNDLGSPEAANAIEEYVEGGSNDTETQTVVTIVDPFSAECNEYRRKSLHSAVVRSASKLFSKLATPDTRRGRKAIR